MQIKQIIPESTIPPGVYDDELDMCESAMDYMEKNLSQCLFIKGENTDGLYSRQETVYFAVLSVDGEEMIARFFVSGIGRKGGIRNPRECLSLEHLALRLGVTVEQLTGDFANSDEEYVQLKPTV